MTATETYNIGAAAAMREALDYIIELINKWRTDNVMEHWQYSQLFDIADAALSAPPRNCDVGTAEEQNNRFARMFCRVGLEGCMNCKLDTLPYRGNTCGIYWGQMPYEGKPKEGGAK